MKTHFSARVVICLHPPFDYNNKLNHEHSENHRDPHIKYTRRLSPHARTCVHACVCGSQPHQGGSGCPSAVKCTTGRQEQRTEGVENKRWRDLDARSSYLNNLHKGGGKIYASDLEIEIERVNERETDGENMRESERRRE